MPRRYVQPTGVYTKAGVKLLGVRRIGPNEYRVYDTSAAYGTISHLCTSLEQAVHDYNVLVGPLMKVSVENIVLPPTEVEVRATKRKLLRTLKALRK